MLNKIKDILIQNGLYFEKEIKDIQYSCCNETLKVLDFDLVKDEFSKRIKIEKPKSCDCLYFCSTRNELFFIEMKDIDRFIIRNSRRITDFKRFRAIVESKLLQYGLDDKIIDSFNILLTILGYYRADLDIFGKIHKNRAHDEIGIKYVLLINLNYSDFISYILGNIDLFSRYDYRFLRGSVTIIRPDDLLNHI